MHRLSSAHQSREKTTGSRSRDNSPRHHRNISEDVEVYCRIRHVNGIVESSDYTESEDSENYDSNKIAACSVVNPKTVALSTVDRRNNKIENITHYAFTQAFSSSVGQKTIFDNVCRPQVDRLLQGGNGLLFAYGVTGSGKTHTMMGNSEQPGILPRTLNRLFTSIQNSQTNEFEIKPDNYNKFFIQPPPDAMMERQEKQLNDHYKKSKYHDQIEFNFESESSAYVNAYVKYAVFISFIEIYNDRVYDLLDDNQRYGMNSQYSKKVREDDYNHAYVDNVNEIEVKSIEEAFTQYYRGKERRRLAQTELNFTSSRSHSIFQIRLVHAPFDSTQNLIYPDKRLLQVSRLALVDLAGSERVSRTGAQGNTLAEASNINTSLMALRRCIEALRKNQKGKGGNFIPFRQKKIVHLFKPFFEGEGKVTILICINPSKSDANETEHVLAFAESAKKIHVETQDVMKMDQDLILKRKQELEMKDAARLDKQAKYKKDLQKNIRYKVPPATAPGTKMDDSDVEDANSDAESGHYTASSTYTVKTSEFDLPENFGSPPPNIDVVNYDDDQIFPKVIQWLTHRKQKLAEVHDVVNRTMPVHVKNLQDLVGQYENHTSHFRELNQKYEQKTKELESEKTRNKRLDAKNNTYQRQINKLERDKQEFEIATQEKDNQIRDLKIQIRNSRSDLDKRLASTERRFRQETDQAVRNATSHSNNILKKREAKLAQLKHVLGKTEAGSNPSPMPRSGYNKPTIPTKPISPARINRPNTRSQSHTRTSNLNSNSRPEAVTQTYSGPITRSTSNTKVNTNPLERQNNAIHAEKTNPVTHSNPLRRRSKSVENLNGQPYLSHKPIETIPTGTILQPNVKVSKHVHVPTNKDLQKHSKYLLTAQTLDSEGELQTQYLKGDIVKTRKINDKADHGIAVQFTDVEILKTRDPIKISQQENDENKYVRNSPNRRSPNRSPNRLNKLQNQQLNAAIKRISNPLDDISNAPSQWTDVQTRCRQAVENKKGELGATVTNVKRAKN